MGLNTHPKLVFLSLYYGSILCKGNTKQTVLTNNHSSKSRRKKYILLGI